MIDRRYVVDRFVFVNMTDNPDNYGILGTVICYVDGAGVGPFLLMRGPDVELRTNYVQSLHPFRQPPFLQAPEARDAIHDRAKALFEEWKKDFK